MEMPEPAVIIVGAGPSGLAVAACLNRLSIQNIVLEREDCFASLWKKKSYDRLHLHVAKQYCELPHMSFPKNYPTYVSKKQFIQYLDDYVAHFNISPMYNRPVVSADYDEVSQKWKVKVRNIVSDEDEEYSGKFMVVATGETSDEFIPEVEGLRNFTGEVIHSTLYKCGDKYRDKRVLVVGSGNSGMEIALDLSNYGAKTSIVVRSPVLPAITSVKGDEVVFQNGKSHPFDAIVFATGFTRSTHKWLKGDNYLLNKDGLAKHSFPNHWKGRNGLYCAGLARRGLNGAAMDAQSIANDVNSALGFPANYILLEKMIFGDFNLILKCDDFN